MYSTKNSVIFVVVLVAVIDSCAALMCNSCNATSSDNSDKLCEERSTTVSCDSYSQVCGSASYTVEVKSISMQMTVRNCFPDVADTCSTLLESTKRAQELIAQLGGGIQINVHERYCNMCKTDYCNSSISFVPSVLMLLLSLVFTKLFIY